MVNRINSKAKGSKNERAATNLMERWTDFPFTRVPQSGGLRWQGGQNITGDIIPEDMYQLEDFPFSIEVKARKLIDFEDLLLPHKSEIMKFWGQSVADAKRVDKIPMVLMRRNGMPKETFYVIIPYNTFTLISKVLNLHNYLIYGGDIVISYSNEFFETDYDLVLDELWAD
jgi:hypothetical protein